MTRTVKLLLPYAEWPEDDRQRWEAAFVEGDLFGDVARAMHLSNGSRQSIRNAYARFFGFLAQARPERMSWSPDARIDRAIIAEYVGSLRSSCAESSIAIYLYHLRFALRIVIPHIDWSWLQNLANRIFAHAKARPKRHHLVTSERLYELGLELMGQAIVSDAGKSTDSKANAADFRDGLIIALLAVVPIRRRTLAAIKIGKQLIRSGDLWALEFRAEDTKSMQELEFSLPENLSARIDSYLDRFRTQLLGANFCNDLWISNKGRCMDGGAIYAMICRRTLKAFGFSVSPHRFRHAAATFWSIQDPENVRGSKDLLGHASFRTTEGHYNITQSRLAGRSLAAIVSKDQQK